MSGDSTPSNSSPSSPSSVKGEESGSDAPPTPTTPSASSEGGNDRIIEKLTSSYLSCSEDSTLLSSTLEHVRENVLKPGICLICIEDVASVEPTWSCSKCHALLHLVCMQRWARDSLENMKERSALRGLNPPLCFPCPKCRAEYGEREFPSKYRCFCGKVENPPPDPWAAPHSCGGQCGKLLQPECGHRCLLLCHSGPCPPCPKQVLTTCFCAQSPPRPLRCFMKKWSCGRVCGKSSSCPTHPCALQCHEGSCPECKVDLSLSCSCSHPQTLLVPCWKRRESSFSLSCEKPCGKALPCGRHKCRPTCHEGECPPCLISCPCGKQQSPCSDQEDSGRPCGEVCDKLLDCGNHRCGQKCHLGGCGACLISVTKRCRCGGGGEKEVLCSKDYSCTNKCRRLRDCGVHPCNKKCCGGDCGPCRVVCGKTLACKNHKCEALCHTGPCYPCPVSAQVKCRCGKTTRSVPCGSEKKALPPSCSQPCDRNSKCDHPKIQAHRCHFGDCPKCRLPCGKLLPSCKHTCPATCHTLKPKKSDKEKHKETSKPCPRCEVIVPSNCALHSNQEIRCYQKSEPCRIECGQQLPCGFHTCSKPCHAPSPCGECREACSRPRPPPCPHGCSLSCHLGPCPTCTLVRKLTCHCGRQELYTPCWKDLNEAEKSCRDQCPKRLSCGHRCLQLCHPPPCPEGEDEEKCRRRVKITCGCGRYSREIDCFIFHEGGGVIKRLECQAGVCKIKKEKEKEEEKIPNPNTNTKEEKEKKPRNRKKNKGNKKGEEPQGSEGQGQEGEESQSQNLGAHAQRRKESVFVSNLKVIGIIGLSAAATALFLKLYGHIIFPPEEL